MLRCADTFIFVASTLDGGGISPGGGPIAMDGR
jgi:hypothetical protein